MKNPVSLVAAIKYVRGTLSGNWHFFRPYSDICIKSSYQSTIATLEANDSHKILYSKGL